MEPLVRRPVPQGRWQVRLALLVTSREAWEARSRAVQKQSAVPLGRSRARRVPSGMRQARPQVASAQQDKLLARSRALPPPQPVVLRRQLQAWQRLPRVVQKQSVVLQAWARRLLEQRRTSRAVQAQSVV